MAASSIGRIQASQAWQLGSLPSAVTMKNTFKLGQLVKFVSGPDTMTEEKIANCDPALQGQIRALLAAYREKAPKIGMIVEIVPSHYIQKDPGDWGCCRVLIADEYRNEIRTCDFKVLEPV